MKNWLRNVWEGKRIIRVLTWANMKAEYSHTLFGFFWLLLKPAIMVLAIVATFYFRAGEIDIVSYALTVTYGVVIWNVMSGVVNSMTELVYTQKNTFLKTTLPREVISLIPLARITVDFVFGFCFIVLAHFFLLKIPSIFSLGLLLSAAFLGLLVSYGIGLIVSILAVYFRDLRYFITHMMRILFFVTPIFLLEFPEGILTKTLYFNPFSLAIIMARSGEYLQHDLLHITLGLTAWAVVLVPTGIWFYGKKIHDTVDIV